MRRRVHHIIKNQYIYIYIYISRTELFVEEKKNIYHATASLFPFDELHYICIITFFSLFVCYLKRMSVRTDMSQCFVL